MKKSKSKYYKFKLLLTLSIQINVVRRIVILYTLSTQQVYTVHSTEYTKGIEQYTVQYRVQNNYSTVYTVQSTKHS